MGGEPRLSHRNILDWAECFPVAFSPFKVRMLKRIDRMLREEAHNIKKESAHQHGRKNRYPPPEV